MELHLDIPPQLEIVARGYLKKLGKSPTEREVRKVLYRWALTGAKRQALRELDVINMQLAAKQQREKCGGG